MGDELQGSPHSIQAPGNHELMVCLFTRLGELYEASPAFDSSLAPQLYNCASLASGAGQLCVSQCRASLSSSWQSYLICSSLCH